MVLGPQGVWAVGT